jgi:hypothetical protein
MLVSPRGSIGRFITKTGGLSTRRLFLCRYLRSF